MRWTIVGVLADAVFGLFMAWFGVVNQIDPRDILPVAIWICICLMAFVLAVGHAWDVRQQREASVSETSDRSSDVTTGEVPAGAIVVVGGSPKAVLHIEGNRFRNNPRDVVLIGFQGRFIALRNWFLQTLGVRAAVSPRTKRTKKRKG